VAKTKRGGMHKSGGTKRRGRSRDIAPDPVAPTKAAFPKEIRTDTTRPVTPGGGKKRGDRRDTNPQFTGNAKHRPNNVDPQGSGRKQIQGGGRKAKVKAD
jgi:hypothetical protein